jgi:DNA (cytosine-5)-methyltransferase 1
VVSETLEHLGYILHARVLDASGWVPQHRERLFIVGFKKGMYGHKPPFEFPPPPKRKHPILRDILEQKPLKKYTLTRKTWSCLKKHASRHKAQGHGFGFGIAPRTGISRTLTARYYKDGSEILVRQRNRFPRKLSPRECARLMGFPDKYPIVVSDTQAYKQFGNSVVPPIIESVGRQILRVAAGRKDG